MATRAPPVPARRSRAFPRSNTAPVETPERGHDVKIYSPEELQGLRSQPSMDSLPAMNRDNLSFVCLDHAQFLEMMKHEEEMASAYDTSAADFDDFNDTPEPPEPSPPPRPTQPPPTALAPAPPPRSASPNRRGPPGAGPPVRGRGERGRGGRGRGRGRGAPMSASSQQVQSPVKVAVPPPKLQKSFSAMQLSPDAAEGVAPVRPIGNLPPAPPGFDFLPQAGYFLPTEEARKYVTPLEESPEPSPNTLLARALGRTASPARQSHSPQGFTAAERPPTQPRIQSGPVRGAINPSPNRRFVAPMPQLASTRSGTPPVKAPPKAPPKVPARASVSEPDINQDLAPPTPPKPEAPVPSKAAPASPGVSKTALQELINTEREYVRDIRDVIIKIFLVPIRGKKLLNKFEIVSIFSNIEAILKVNSALLKDLEAPNADIATVFQSFAKEMKRPYSIYCSNQPNVRTTLAEYNQSNPALEKFLKAAFRKSECRKLNLESFLIIPLQRLCKYPLLLKEIQKENEHLPDFNATLMQEALDEIRTVVNDVNNRVREVENLVKLMSIANSLENGGTWPIIDPTRQYYMEGEVHVGDQKKFVYLFNDAMLFCDMRAPSPSTHKLVAYRMLPLSLAVTTDLPNGDDAKYQFELAEIGKDSLVLSFPTALKKRKWLRAIDNYIAENASAPQDEKKRETVAQMKAVVAPPRPARAPRKKKPMATTKILKSDAVQKHPDIVRLRNQIAKERKAREEAEAHAEQLKQALQQESNKESKQQRATDSQTRIGHLCGVVGQLSVQKATLTQRIASYRQEIDQLRALAAQ